MKKIYFLGTCSTCKRILNELKINNTFDVQDIKKDPLTAEDIAALYERTGSYEALINKRAQQYQKRGLKNKSLTENDFKNLLLEHYTFLKRPVIILGDQIFIGNSNKVVEAAQKALGNGA